MLVSFRPCPMLVRSLALVTLGGGLVLGVGSLARGQLIAREPFRFDGVDYKLSSIDGQNPITVPGFTNQGSSAWQATNGRFRVIDTSLAADGFPNRTGGSLMYAGEANDGFERAARSIDTFATPNSYFMNFLLHPGGPFAIGSSADGRALVGFTSPLGQAEFRNEPTADEVVGALVGFAARRPSPLAPLQTDLVIHARNANGDLEETVVLANVTADPVQVVLKIEPDGNSGKDRLSYWVNPKNVNSETAMTSTATKSDTWLTDSLLANQLISQLTVVTDRWGRDLVLDEPRMSGGSLFALFSTPLQCDLNGDGTVDAFDMGILFANWNKPGLGDLNGDGIVDAADAGICFAEWTGDPAPVPSAAVSSLAVPPLAVPEPHAMRLALLALVLFVPRPRR